jgi:predicted nucleic acid-binding protein
MAVSPDRVYWDSCSWIALILDEKIPRPDGTIEYRGALCRSVITKATNGGIEIFTSALTLIEVNKMPQYGSQPTRDMIRDFFQNDYIVVVNIDRQVGELGRELMRRGYAKLKPADASHIAAAVIAEVTEMHTFDDRLLALDGKIDKADGTKLRICKTSTGGPRLPLLEHGTG